MAESTVGSVEHTTTLALHEKKKLIKSLRRFDMLLFLVCAIVGLDTLGQVSTYGAQTFTWVIVLAVVFLFPYALVMAEVGSAFTQEGGPYEWMKLAWGRFVAGIGAVLYWVTNPLWVGGSLAFIATAAWSKNYFTIGAGTAGDYVFKAIFIWVSIGVAIIALRYGKWIPNFGAIVRFMAVLIEHYAGALPTWLCPEQVRVIPVTDAHVAYAQSVVDASTTAGLRATVDASGEKLGALIRRAKLLKIPYVLVVGDRDTSAGTVGVNRRGWETKPEQGVETRALVAEVAEEVAGKGRPEVRAPAAGPSVPAETQSARA